MTITQHLEFSVLTAPLAAVDRRGLSQAWYSALYGESRPVPQTANPKPALGAPRSPNPAPRRVQSVACTRSGPSASKPAAHPEERPLPSNGIADRRAPRSSLARKIERAFLDPKTRMQKASFTLDGGQGRVQVLLRACGENIKIVALCPRKATKQVTAALAQARYALARRGIALECELREAAIC